MLKARAGRRSSGARKRRRRGDPRGGRYAAWAALPLELRLARARWWCATLAPPERLRRKPARARNAPERTGKRRNGQENGRKTKSARTRAAAGADAVLLPCVLPGRYEAGAALLEGNPRNYGADYGADRKKTGHDFAWLHDLRAHGSERARKVARARVAAWFNERPRGRRVADEAWEPAVAAARLANCSLAWAFFGASADASFRRDLLAALIRQSDWLIARCLNGSGDGTSRGTNWAAGGEAGRDAILVHKGPLLVRTLLGRPDAAFTALLERLHRCLDAQLLADGGQRERSPERHKALMADLAELRLAFAASKTGGVMDEHLPKLDALLAPMASVLNLYRHGDGDLALFHGTALDGALDSDLLLRRAGATARAAVSAPLTGFERLRAGRLSLLMDTGGVPPPGLDGRFHLAPGAMEIAVGHERLIVNCGTAASDPWSRALRGTAAHSCLAVASAGTDARDAGRFLAPTWRGAGVEADFGNIRCERREQARGVELRLAHDAWRAAQARTERRILLAENGLAVRGTETVRRPSGAGPATVTLRFHLASQVRAERARDGRSILLRLARGGLWRLRLESEAGAAEPPELALEDGIYCPAGRPQRSRQAVLHMPIRDNETKIIWSLRFDAATTE